VSLRSPLRPITAKLALVIILFAAVPAVLYQQFRVAEGERTALMLDGIANQGRAIVESLRPTLMKADPTELAQVGQRMAALAGNQVGLRLLYRPRESTIDSFLLVAAVPPVAPDALEAERGFLIRSRLLETAWNSCDATEPIGRTLDNGGDEQMLVVSRTGSGRRCCWHLSCISRWPLSCSWSCCRFREIWRALSVWLD
jgi:two-component system, OmpR family, sensor histidine kinase ChvG